LAGNWQSQRKGGRPEKTMTEATYEIEEEVDDIEDGGG
jgi:hypothetical protein